MLYDPKWEQPKPDIFALDTLIGWLEKQRPTKLYIYSSTGNCLLAQYFRSMTDLPVIVTRSHVHIHTDMNGHICDIPYPLPNGWNAIAKGGFFRPIHTFGGALKRAKRLRTKAAVGSIFARIPQLLGLT